MNFGDSGGIGWVVDSYLATPEGRNTVKKYLTSPEGIKMLQKFAGTPEGKVTIVHILPHILDGLNLPRGLLIQSRVPLAVSSVQGFLFF